MTAIDLVSIDQALAWKPWAVAYFLVVGAAAGAALIAVAAGLRGGASQARGALRAAAVLALSAPLPLFADLHQPARVLNFYLSGATGSVMWWGAWLMPLFVLATLAATLLDAAGARAGLLRSAFIAMAVFGLGVLGYTAGELWILAARPLWHSLGFPLVLTLTAITSGAGAVLLVPEAAGRAAGLARRVLAVSAALAAVSLGVWILADPRMAALAHDHMPLTVIFHVLILGLALPAGLAIANQGRAAAVLAGLAAIWGALAFRWALFTAGQTLSKVETTHYPGPGFTDAAVLQSLVGTLGMIALAVVIVTILVAHVAPAFGPRATADKT